MNGQIRLGDIFLQKRNLVIDLDDSLLKVTVQIDAAVSSFSLIYQQLQRQTDYSVGYKIIKMVLMIVTINQNHFYYSCWNPRNTSSTNPALANFSFVSFVP